MASEASLSSSGTRREVYLLVTPLQCYYTRGFQRWDFFAARCENNRVPFRRLQHWAVQVGDDVNGEIYEVTSYGDPNKKRDLRFSSAKQWRKSRQHQLRCTRKLFITITERSTPELESVAYSVWDAVFQDEYRAMSRNCQSFAELFKGIIEDQYLIDENARMGLEEMPSSFNPFYAVFHLKEAKTVAARWTRRVLRRKQPLSPSAGDKPRIHDHSRLPGKRSRRWIELVNEASKHQDWQEKDAVRAMIAHANHTHKNEMLSGESTKRRLTTHMTQTFSSESTKRRLTI